MTARENELADRLEARAEYWEGKCNRLNYGACQTRACLVRGGWKRGDPVDYDLATCETRESCNTDLAAASTLRANAARIKALEGAHEVHVAALLHARGIFQEYGRLHRAKTPPDEDKAQRNFEHADDIGNAIARAARSNANV